MSGQEIYKETFTNAANTLTRLYMLGLQGHKTSYQQGVNETILKLHNFIRQDVQTHPEDKDSVNRLNNFLNSLATQNQKLVHIPDNKVLVPENKKPEVTKFQPIEFQFTNFNLDVNSEGPQFEQNTFTFANVNTNTNTVTDGFNFPPFTCESTFKDEFGRKRNLEEFDFENHKRMKPDQ
jgi:hypothetical protein